MNALDDPAQLSQPLAVLMLLVARMVPLAALVPWLAPREGVPLVGLALAVVLATALWPTALAGAPVLPTSALTLAALAVREVLIGAVYAVALALPLLALRWAGGFIDRARGAPESESEASALGTLLLWLGVLAFFALGGHRVAIDVLAASVAAHPVGVLQAPADPADLALGSARMLAEAFAAALLVALPALAALLIAELALGLSMRLSATLPFSALLPGGRAALGLAMVWVSAAFLLYGLPAAFEESLAAASRLFQAL
ncbi:MAG: flagellar biosynthetic protein FliR [Myxococcales bacterium]|nr:flagellar biosynthetic protein FliR [Myxococcales bacterium]